MPFDTENQYVYEQYGDDASSNGQHSSIIATMVGDMSSFKLIELTTDVPNAKLVRHFAKADGELQFCGTGPNADAECKDSERVTQLLVQQ